MKLYHGTDEDGWLKIQKSGYLLSKNKDIYFHPIVAVAKSFGDIVLEFDINDNYLNELIEINRIDYINTTHDYIFYKKILLNKLERVNI